MKYSIVETSHRAARTSRERAAGASGWWVQFGDTQLIYSAATKWASVTDAIGRTGLPADGDIKKGDMHLVTQKGRTFQQAHPDIPVILDKGRYIVVDVPKAKAKKLVNSDETCFTITPLRENSVVFDIATPKAMSARNGAADLVATLDQAAYAADVEHLVSFHTRQSTSQDFHDAADWCEVQLSGLGYATNQVSVAMPGGAQSSSVIATRPGTAADSKSVMVVAHLDSVNHVDGPASRAPGADDNASGSAGVLALARAMAPHQFEHDLTFILFGGEEQGLLGSDQFVDAMSAAERERTKAVVNMDMIGHVNTPSPTVLLEGASFGQDMIDALASAAAQYTSLGVQTSHSFASSDHVPFLLSGITSTLTIEGADGANNAIHTANDTLDRVDPAFAMEILKMNLGYLAEAAGVVVQAETEQPAAAAHQHGDCGCAGCGQSQDLRQLLLHYQMLLAQYSRLSAADVLSSEDVLRVQELRAAHDRLLAQENEQ